MLIFKSMSDLAQLSRDAPEHATVENVMKRVIGIPTDRPYQSDEDGYLILAQPHDLGAPLSLPEVDCRLEEVLWEGVTYEDGFFHAVHICNNQFTLSFLIPDAPWVTGRLRASLEANLSS